ncbi:uncharacterized protein LOC142232734 [Haematobia irritans]|uniref:uncharacterized protein LOC142232734 n=1 Tax=Haematobia irritans TaxID=7368 RepID=UPI003F4FEB1D
MVPIIHSIQFNYVEKNVKFTNLQCELLDSSFASIKKCQLRALARDVVSLNLHVALHQLPVGNISFNGQLYHRGNGYRPFMYNDTIDFCSFVKKPSRNMIWKIIYEMFKPYTNINHSCPYNHDLIIDKWILKPEMFELIPFPENDYMVEIQAAAYNVYRAKTYRHQAASSSTSRVRSRHRQHHFRHQQNEQLQ